MAEYQYAEDDNLNMVHRRSPSPEPANPSAARAAAARAAPDDAAAAVVAISLVNGTTDGASMRADWGPRWAETSTPPIGGRARRRGGAEIACEPSTKSSKAARSGPRVPHDSQRLGQSARVVRPTVGP